MQYIKYCIILDTPRLQQTGASNLCLQTPRLACKLLGVTGSQLVRCGTHTPSKAPHHSNKGPYHHYSFLHNDFSSTHTHTLTRTRQHIYVKVLRRSCWLLRSAASPPGITQSEHLQNAGLLTLLARQRHSEAQEDHFVQRQRSAANCKARDLGGTEKCGSAVTDVKVKCKGGTGEALEEAVKSLC